VKSPVFANYGRYNHRVRSWFLQLLLVLALAVAAPSGTKDDKYSESLRYSCRNDTFLSATASAPRHDSFLTIELALVDPERRSAGTGAHEHPIPRSQYGKIVEMPTHPEMSKVTGVEVCGAIPGRYVINVYEHGNFEYRLSVSGNDGTGSNYGNETQPLMLETDGDRVCRYRFAFVISKGRVAIQWLDSAGHPLRMGESPSCEVVPVA
jgi:hypothetical protein